MLLEYIQQYETLKDKEDDFTEILKNKADAESYLQLIHPEGSKSTSERKQKDSDVHATLKEITTLEIKQNETKLSIESQVVDLSQLYITNKESFNQCFAYFNQTMLGASTLSRNQHRLQLF